MVAASTGHLLCAGAARDAGLATALLSVLRPAVRGHQTSTMAGWHHRHERCVLGLPVRDLPRRYRSRRSRADRSRAGHRYVARPGDAPGHLAAGRPHHHPTDGQHVHRAVQRHITAVDPDHSRADVRGPDSGRDQLPPHHHLHRHRRPVPGGVLAKRGHHRSARAASQVVTPRPGRDRQRPTPGPPGLRVARARA